MPLEVNSLQVGLPGESLCGANKMEFGSSEKEEEDQPSLFRDIIPSLSSLASAAFFLSPPGHIRESRRPHLGGTSFLGYCPWRMDQG